MNNLNSIIVEGTLVKDPVFHTTPQSKSSCTFSIASSRFFKAETKIEEEVSHFDIETYGKLAESCQKLGHEGRGVKVVGRLKQNRWTDSNGKEQSKLIIVAEHAEFRPE
jgi:single-strand DNA-binding protein